VELQKRVGMVCLWILASLLCSGCYHRARVLKKRISVHYDIPQRHILNKNKKHADATDPSITVWIHGTKFMRSDTYKRVYNGIPDIKHINEFPSEHGIQFQMQLLDRDASVLFRYDDLYLFGWSGRLSTHERYWAAVILYQKLTMLYELYTQKYGKAPRIRLVTHSHGGNVALNLARIHKARKASFEIDTLVLLACPVQHETKTLAENIFFKNVYAFYSSLDMVQVLAPEFVHRMRDDEDSVVGSCLRWIPFSTRCFECKSRVRQAWIKINGHAIMHSSFTRTQFLRTLPQLLKTVDELYAEHGTILCRGERELLLHVRSKCINGSS
jgi:hypothetical protein